MAGGNVDLGFIANLPCLLDERHLLVPLRVIHLYRVHVGLV